MEPERCDECGFDGSRFDAPALVAELRALGPSWRALIESAGPELRVRPAPKVWSAIEYAAHSRDITALHAFGVEQALTEDEPHYPAIEADLVETVAESYADEQPATVVAALDEQAKRLATLADENGGAAWARGLTLGSERTDVRRLLEHALHDSTHHLRDVERGLAQMREARA
jgi:S-DNA-T family DNA segregation ATPase FtsK/SpoIIIE